VAGTVWRGPPPAPGSSGPGSELCELPEDHWARWLRNPVDFATALQAAKAVCPATVLEMGPHPVLTGAIKARHTGK
jgi:acyl transferase domain-containing protein